MKGREIIQPRPILPGGDPKEEGDITNSEVLPKGKQLASPVPLMSTEKKVGLITGKGCRKARLHTTAALVAAVVQV